MSLTLSVIDDTYSANDSTGRKHLFATVSLTNPYTASGETVDLTSYFKNKFLGGTVRIVNPSVSIDNAGIVASGTFRGDTNSVSTTNLSTGGGNPVLQFFNIGLSGTAKAGLRVDNTVANLSSSTIVVDVLGY